MTDSIDLSVQIAPGLRLINPVMTASGTFGYGNEYGELVDIQKLGAIICKGTTLEPRDGNEQPRIIEVTGGILNSVGLQNIGVEALDKRTGAGLGRLARAGDSQYRRRYRRGLREVGLEAGGRGGDKRH